MFENRALRKIFGPKGDEEAEEWRRLLNEEHYGGEGDRWRMLVNAVMNLRVP